MILQHFGNLYGIATFKVIEKSSFIKTDFYAMFMLSDLNLWTLLRILNLTKTSSHYSLLKRADFAISAHIVCNWTMLQSVDMGLFLQLWGSFLAFLMYMQYVDQRLSHKCKCTYNIFMS